MSSRDPGGSAALLVFLVLAVIAGAVILLIAIFKYLVMAWIGLSSFMAFTWSLVCMFALRRPLRLGNLFVHTEDARAFLIRGVFGAAVVPGFLGLITLFTEVQVPWQYGFYFALSGYSVFSVGFEIFVARARGVPYVQPHYQNDFYPRREPSRHRQLEGATTPRLPKFATWDDEV